MDDKAKRQYHAELKKDTNSFDNFKKIAGKNRPDVTLESYRKSKHTNVKEWQEIKDSFKRSKASFASEKSLLSHYEAHGEQFSSLSREEYLSHAQFILSQIKSERYFAYESGTRRVRYDVKDNVFALGNIKNSKIITMFKPDEGADYFETNQQRDTKNKDH